MIMWECFLASMSFPIWLYLWGLLTVNEKQRGVLHYVPALHHYV